MRRAALLLGKDLRILRRSRALVAALVLYPLLIALLVGLVARFAADRPRVAFVDLDRLPSVLVVGGEKFEIEKLVEDVEDEVELVRLSEEEAERRLETGEVAAVITVPRGFASRLRGMARSPTLVLRTSGGGLSERVERQAEALVYNLNRRLQQAYIEANLEYVQIIREGGSGSFLGNDFDVVGLDAAARTLEEIERTTDDPAVAARAHELSLFVRQASIALGETGAALEATANPIRLETDEGRGRALVSAQLQAYALALTLAFLCIALAAAGIAAERDENVLARLARGLVRMRELVAAKVALAALAGVVLGVTLAVVFAAALELAAGDETVEPWRRVPLLALCLAVAGAAFGAVGVLLGVLAREARTASLVALLVTLPLVLLGLLPRAAVGPAAWLSEALPFAHAVRLFESALYELEPWRTLATELGWLVALAAAYATAARIGVRRLLS